MDYSELVKSLRICGHWKSDVRFPGKDGCDGCMYHDAENNVCKSWIPDDDRKERIMLDAADAIEELQQIASHYEETAKDYFKDVCYYLERVPKWIPVTERLPEDREMVIGFTPCDGFMFVGYHVTSVYHDRDYSYWNIVTAMRSTRKMTKKVTHWMPLPEPPKEETE